MRRFGGRQQPASAGCSARQPASDQSSAVQTVTRRTVSLGSKRCYRQHTVRRRRHGRPASGRRARQPSWTRVNASHNHAFEAYVARVLRPKSARAVTTRVGSRPGDAVAVGAGGRSELPRRGDDRANDRRLLFLGVSPSTETLPSGQLVAASATCRLSGAEPGHNSQHGASRRRRSGPRVRNRHLQPDRSAPICG